jgi:hypothetical protein
VINEEFDNPSSCSKKVPICSKPVKALKLAIIKKLLFGASVGMRQLPFAKTSMNKLCLLRYF